VTFIPRNFKQWREVDQSTLKLDDFAATDDNTDLDASTTKHGLMPKWTSALISALLDLISTTRGAILYRGSSAWSALNPGTNGDVLTSNGTGADPSYETPSGGPGGGGALDVVQALAIDDIATEETLYTYSVPGNTIAGGVLRLTLAGDYLNNSGASRTFTLRIKYGATTLYDDATASIGATAVRRNWELQVTLGNTASTNDQWMTAKWIWGSGTATAGQGDFALTPGALTTFQPLMTGTAAEDSTASKTLAVTIQHSTNNASLEIIRKIGVLEALAP